jgi:hypothetical protein
MRFPSVFVLEPAGAPAGRRRVTGEPQALKKIESPFLLYLILAGLSNKKRMSLSGFLPLCQNFFLRFGRIFDIL